MTTFAPSARKPRAIALPRPCDPPVIRTRRSVSARSMYQVHLFGPFGRGSSTSVMPARRVQRAAGARNKTEITRTKSVTIAGSESAGQDHGFLVEPGAAADP